MSNYNIELLDLCRKNRELPIIIVGESMADLCGYVSTYGRISYCGKRLYENDIFSCKGDIPTFIHGKHFFKFGGNIKFADSVETLLSLLYFQCNQWGYRAICKIIRRLEPDVDWWTPTVEYNLLDILYQKLDTAIALGEEDETIYPALEFRLSNSKVSKLKN